MIVRMGTHIACCPLPLTLIAGLGSESHRFIPVVGLDAASGSAGWPRNANDGKCSERGPGPLRQKLYGSTIVCPGDLTNKNTAYINKGREVSQCVMTVPFHTSQNLPILQQLHGKSSGGI